MTDSGFLQVDGVRLEARRTGPPPEEALTLVFLHEGLGSASLWRDFPDRLSAETGCGALIYSRAGLRQVRSRPPAAPHPFHARRGGDPPRGPGRGGRPRARPGGAQRRRLDRTDSCWEKSCRELSRAGPARADPGGAARLRGAPRARQHREDRGGVPHHRSARAAGAASRRQRRRGVPRLERRLARIPTSAPGTSRNSCPGSPSPSSSSRGRTTSTAPGARSRRSSGRPAVRSSRSRSRSAGTPPTASSRSAPWRRWRSSSDDFVNRTGASPRYNRNRTKCRNSTTKRISPGGRHGRVRQVDDGWLGGGGGRGGDGRGDGAGGRAGLEPGEADRLSLGLRISRPLPAAHLSEPPDLHPGRRHGEQRLHESLAGDRLLGGEGRLQRQDHRVSQRQRRYDIQLRGGASSSPWWLRWWRWSGPSSTAGGSNTRSCTIGSAPTSVSGSASR